MIVILAGRIRQIKTGIHWPEEPVSRFEHIVTNVEVVSAEGDEIRVNSKFFCYQNRLQDEVNHFVGRREDLLRRDDFAAAEEGSVSLRIADQAGATPTNFQDSDYTLTVNGTGTYDLNGQTQSINFLNVLGGTVSLNGGNAIAANGHIDHARFFARAVVNRPAFDQDIELVAGRWLEAAGERRQCDRSQENKKETERQKAIIHS